MKAYFYVYFLKIKNLLKFQFNSDEHSKTNSYSNNTTNSSTSKHAKKVAAIEESVQSAFLRNMTISDEFMKWCHEQLKDFQVECNFNSIFYFLFF